MRIVFFLLPMAAAAAEHATYDPDGRLRALLARGATIPVQAELVMQLKDGSLIRPQPGGEHSPVRRAFPALRWSGPAGPNATFEALAEERDRGVTLSYTLKPAVSFTVEAAWVEFRLPRDYFLHARVEAGAARAVLTPHRAREPYLPGTAATEVRLLGGARASFSLRLEQPLPVTLRDVWDRRDRDYVLRVEFHRGPLDPASPPRLVLACSASSALPPPAARLSLGFALPPRGGLPVLNGFGGNYCFNLDSPVVEFTLANLRSAWARVEIPLDRFDRERAAPSPRLIRYFEVAAKVHRKGIPWIASIWWLPERLYTDPNQQPRSAHNRRIAPDQWGNFLELLGVYLLHLKTNYGAEPDYFSFNEANIGVYVLFTPEEHRDALKRIGAHFEKLGLKTRMLLADATGPRDTHLYALPAANDPEAMKTVGAVGFHSWGGGTPAQLRAWDDLARWLELPLVVAELGLDAFAWRNRKFDSFHYGLEEAQLVQDLLRHARPQALLYWEFTPDYALVTRDLKPTGRFWLMKHFTDLTPPGAEHVHPPQDLDDLSVTVFRKGADVSIHILNTGPARTLILDDTPPVNLEWVVTTEESSFQKHAPPPAHGNIRTVSLPARSLSTLTTLPVPACCAP